MKDILMQTTIGVLSNTLNKDLGWIAAWLQYLETS